MRMVRPPASRGVSRRALLLNALAGTGVAAAGVAAGGSVLGGDVPQHRAVRRLHGERQGGIVSAPLPFLSFAAFDMTTRRRDGLVTVLQTWTRAAEEIVASCDGDVTFTFGFGPSLFADARFGLADRRPAPLVALPAFAGEALDPGASNGDLGVQVCASNPTLAHHAVRSLVNGVRPHAKLRWRQTGFRDSGRPGDPRGLLGFRDGTANLDVRDATQTAKHLWVGDGPEWLRGGTYLVTRHIRLLLDTWDRTIRTDQEAVLGRARDSNLRTASSPTAHAQLAAPAANGGVTLLRRSFSYDSGTDPNGLIDSGLIFICFQRDPAQFVTVQRRLASSDALNAFSQHLASALFACPPGIARGSYVGERLLV